MTFTKTNADLRTDPSFNEMQDEDYHCGRSSLHQLGIQMVSLFPLDYMHLVCLGVVKKMILLWMNGTLAIRIGAQATTTMSDTLLRFKVIMPKEFARKGRSLREVDRWKATELNTFLLYSGIASLKEVLSAAMYVFWVGFIIVVHIHCVQ